MAEQAGLGGVAQQGNQAGLSDQPMTMGERFRMSRAMRQQGYSADDIRTALGMENAPAETPAGMEEDRTVGIFGDLGYGARRMVGDWFSGAGEGLEDHLGWEGTGDALKSLGEYVGPSEAQEQAQADEAAYRQEQVDAGEMGATEQFAREAGDAIVESTPALVGVAGGGMAGAAAGAAIGSVLPGPGTAVGAAVGGLIGAVAASLPMMYEEQLQTAEANGHDRNDPAIQKKALTGAAINTSMDVITPLKILRKVNPGKAVEIAQQSILKKGVKDALKDAAVEGGTEVAQMATGAILFDEELQAQLSKEDKAALVPYIVQEYGREIALNFVAGAGAGGAFGAAAGMRQQQLVNAKIKTSAEVLSRAAETTGAPIADLTAKAKTPEGAREIADAAAEIQLAEIKRENAKALYDADPTPERKKLFAKVEAEADATYDRIMPTFGGRKLTEVKAEREAVQANEKQTAFQKLKDQGLKPKADATYEAVTTAAKKVETAAADLAQAEERLAVAATPKSKARVEQQVAEAEKTYAKTKAEAARSVGDTSIDEASILKERVKKADEVKAVEGREKAIERDLAANFPAWMTPEQKKARAQEIITEATAKPDAELVAQHRKLAGKIAKALPGSPEQARLQRQIDQLGTRMGGVSPAVEAARRVLQAEGGGSATGSATGSSPGAASTATATEAAADVKAGQTKEGAAVSPEAAAPGKPDILRPRDIKPETINRFAAARAASAKAPELTAETEAIARDLLIEGGAEPTQANIDILVKSPGVIAKRLAQITKAPKSKDSRLTEAIKAGYDIPGGGKWQPLLDVVDVADDMEAAEANLRDWTRDTGKEASATFDAAGNVLGAGTNNDPNGIMPPANGWGTTAVAMTHTHPEDTPFSLDDVLVLATSPMLEVYRAVTPTQTIEMRPSATLRATAQDDLIGRVSRVKRWLIENLPLEIEGVSAARIQQEAQLRLLARQGLIDYTTPMAGFTAIEEDYINGAVDAAVSNLQSRDDDRGAAAPGEEVASREGRADTGPDRLSGSAPSQASRGRDAAYPEFHAAWRAGARNEDLIQRPEFVAAIGKMMTTPLTSRRPGFNSPQWHADRTYNIDGKEIVGTAAALDAFYEQARTLAANELRLPVKPLRNDRILTIVTGPPASGKSTIANEIAYSQGAAILDSDEFKKALPEFGDGSGANAVHTESKAITDAMEELMLADGVNIVYPKVGHEAGSITTLGRRFRAQGYTVNFVNLDVPVETAMNRMLGRFGTTGRLIPPSYLLEEVGDNPSRTHNEMERTGEFDGYARLDGLTPYGRTPEVLSQTGNPLAGTKFAPADGSPAERGPAAAQPGNAGDTGRQAGPKISRGIDEALEEEGIGETRGVRGRARGDREALKQLSQSVLSWATTQPKKRGPQPPFLSLAQAGDLTVENLSKATDALLSGIGASAGRAMMNAGVKLFPAADGDPQVALALGLGLTNAIARQGFGGFTRRDTPLWDASQRQMVNVSTFGLDEKLKEFLGLKKFGFLPPMQNPDDTSQIKLDGDRNLMSGPALERAEATARMLQAQRYTIDQAAVDAIVTDPGVLISKKTRGPNEVLSNSRAALTKRLSYVQAQAAAITRADVKPLMPAGTSNYNLDKAVTAIQSAAQALTLEDIGYSTNRAPLDAEAIARATLPLTNALSAIQLKGADPANPVARLTRAATRLGSDNLKGQMEIAKQRAARLKDYADGARGREIGFRYGIDKKGRLYPDGEFHHQSGDAIKGIFRPVGSSMSLAEMDSFDHTGSGWQIAALIARDDTIAARVNIKAGMASDPNPPKGDIYTGVVGKMVARIEQDIARGDASAIWFRDTIMNPVIEERSPPGAPKSFADLVRPDFKTPVIAVNYGGSERQFTEALFTAFGDKLRNTKAPPAFWSYFQEVGGEAISSEAPAVIRFKEWAISELERAVKAAVEQGIDPSTLSFTVGPDAKYTAVKKLLDKPKDIEARDNTEGAAFPSVHVTIRDPIAPNDPLKGINYAKTAKNIFSQIIQGYDAAVMHDAVRRYREAVPDGFMATNHDSYTIPDENRAALARAVNEALHAMITKGGNVAERLAREIREQVGLEPSPLPEPGNYNLDDVLTSMPVWREGKGDAKDSPMSVPAPAVSRARDTLAERRTPEQIGSTGTRLENNLSSAFALAATKQYRTGRELKLDLDARSRAAQAEQGIDLTTFTPETAERLSDFAVEDALEALQDNANAVGWYDDTVRRALAELEQLHPELKTDKEARLKFIWALAVTSNGIKVDRNFQMANIAYEYSKEGHSSTFPTDLGAGDAARAINGGLRMYDVLLEKMGGVDALLEFMTTKRPVREIEKISGVAVSGEGKAEMVYGAAILGPKIGNGFFANLYGNFDALTMDRWLMRTVGRWRGTLVTPNEPMIAAKREGLKALIKSLTPAQMKYLQGFFNGSPVKVKKIISVSEIDAMAAEIAKRSMAPSWRENLSQTNEGNQMRLLGNALTGYLDGQNEAPGGATERTFLRKVFSAALERLRAIPGNEALTMADLQALLWYPERRLYDAAKTSGDQQKGYADDEAPDYANAARKLVRDRLGSDAGSGPDAGGSGPRADAGAPAVSRGTDGPDVRQRRARAGDYGGVLRPAQAGERVAGSPVKSVREFPDGRHVYETDPATFSRMIASARVNLGPVGAQVGSDTGTRQFLIDDGTAGFALDGEDIISVFSTPGTSKRGAAARMLQAAVAEGGKTLNAFDTFLPMLYAKSGFRSVARLPFNREYAPEGWDYDFFKAKYDNAEPDVLFMVYDPDNATSLTDNAVEDYDAGLAAQSTALSTPQVSRGVDMKEARIGKPPGPEVEFRLTNTSMKPRDRVANVRHELTSYDRDTVLAHVIDRGRDGPTYRQVVADTEALMTGWINGVRLSVGDKAAMLAAASEHRRQKGMYAFRPMDQRMATDTYREMGRLMAEGRMDEGDIARALNKTREQASKIAAIARSTYANTPQVSRGIDSLFRRPALAPAAQPALPGITSSRQGAPTPYATAMAAAKDGSVLRRMGRAIERQVFNQQAGLKQIERALGDDGMSLGEGMSRMAQMMTASSGRVAAMMQYGAPKWDAKEKVFTYAPGTKGLTQIFKFDSVDDYDRFQGWAFAKRDRGLMARGKGARMTPALLAQYENIPAADKVRYNEMLADYRTFNEAMLDLMQDSGLISQESRDALSEDQEYVPMFRAFEDASEFGMQNFFGKAAGFSHPDPGIRKLKDNPAKVGEPNGGNFADLIEGIQSGAIAALHAAQQNIANAQIHDFMSGNLGHEVQDIKAATGIGIRTLGRNAKKKAFNALEQNAIKFYRDGKEVYYKAVGENTEFTAAFQLALAGLRPAQLDGIDKALKAFNSFQRTVITSTPSFALASVVRDVGQSYVQSGTRINETLKNNASQFRQAFAGADQATKDLMMAAGVGGYQMQGMPENTAESFRRKIGAQSNTLWSNAGKWLSEYERVIGSTELGARSAVAESTKRKGGTKGDAAYEALNMIDYNRKGASAAVQRLLYMVLFLNPRLQGLYRLFENTKGNDPRKIAAVSASVLARGLVLSGVAMAARMLSTLDDDDEEAYRNLSVSDRAQYFHIPLPGTARFLKLPKPFEIGAIFGTLPVQIFDSMYSSQNGTNDLGRMVGHTFVNTFSLNPIPQAVVPMVEVMFNYDMFNGMPIEGMRLEGLPKELRIDLSTGGIAQALGSKMLSPVQIQHILDGYLGPLGSNLYAGAEGVVAGAGLVAPKATASDGAFGALPSPARWAANFTVGRFVSRTDAERSTQFVTEFYDVSNQIKQYTAAINAAVGMGDMVEARRLAEQSQDKLRLKPVFAKVNRRLTEINKALRVAQFSPDMDPAERQRRIDILNVERNRLTRGAVEIARKSGVKGSFLGGLAGFTT